MRWFKKIEKTAQADPFAFQGTPSVPKGPVPAPEPYPESWGAKFRPPSARADQQAEQFGKKDPHTRITNLIRSLKPEQLAALADHLEAPGFMDSLGAPAAPTQSPETQMPPQTQVQAPQQQKPQAFDRPATTPALEDLQRSFQQNPAPAPGALPGNRPMSPDEERKERLKQGRPPGMGGM